MTTSSSNQISANMYNSSFRWSAGSWWSTMRTILRYIWCLTMLLSGTRCWRSRRRIGVVTVSNCRAIVMRNFSFSWMNHLYPIWSTGKIGTSIPSFDPLSVGCWLLYSVWLATSSSDTSSTGKPNSTQTTTTRLTARCYSPLPPVSQPTIRFCSLRGAITTWLATARARV